MDEKCACFVFVRRKKKAAEETDKERGFKEGLANNSDTEKK